jgi:hypothetical protein
MQNIEDLTAAVHTARDMFAQYRDANPEPRLPSERAILRTYARSVEKAEAALAAVRTPQPPYVHDTGGGWTVGVGRAHDGQDYAHLRIDDGDDTYMSAVFDRDTAVKIGAELLTLLDPDILRDAIKQTICDQTFINRFDAQTAANATMNWLLSQHAVQETAK